MKKLWILLFILPFFVNCQKEDELPDEVNVTFSIPEYGLMTEDFILTKFGDSNSFCNQKSLIHNRYSLKLKENVGRKE